MTDTVNSTSIEARDVWMKSFGATDEMIVAFRDGQPARKKVYEDRQKKRDGDGGTGC